VYAVKAVPIVISEADERSIRRLLGVQSSASLHDQGHLQELTSELERAQVLEGEEIPADVITMHSQVRVLDLESCWKSDLTLVFPSEADIEANQISVLAPLGTALLGLREGDEVQWRMPGGVRRLRIERVRQKRTGQDTRRTGTAATRRGASDARRRMQ
jgi:regulator of nucleoside diphosphate kinase